MGCKCAHPLEPGETRITGLPLLDVYQLAVGLGLLHTRIPGLDKLAGSFNATPHAGSGGDEPGPSEPEKPEDPPGGPGDCQDPCECETTERVVSTQPGPCPVVLSSGSTVWGTQLVQLIQVVTDCWLKEDCRGQCPDPAVSYKTRRIPPCRVNPVDYWRRRGIDIFQGPGGGSAYDPWGVD